MTETRTKHLTTLGMMAAMACLVMLIRIPVIPAAPFLTYDPKDVIVVIGGFMFGPAAAIMLALVAGLVEMVTVSDTGFWGLLMNVVSSAAFAVPAAAVYKFHRTLKGAVIGLVLGVATVVPVMVIMNILVVPLFVPFADRAWVIEHIVPIFLPFNAIKYGLNAAVTLLVYKPVVTALTAAGLFRPGSTGAGPRRYLHLGVVLAAFLLIVGLALAIIIMQVTYEVPFE